MACSTVQLQCYLFVVTEHSSVLMFILDDHCSMCTRFCTVVRRTQSALLRALAIISVDSLHRLHVTLLCAYRGICVRMLLA
jgi:hypothetical protein